MADLNLSDRIHSITLVLAMLLAIVGVLIIARASGPVPVQPQPVPAWEDIPVYTGPVVTT